MKNSALKYYLFIHAGLVLLGLMYFISGYDLSTMFVSLSERFNVHDVDRWSFDTISYAYVDFIIFTFFCLFILSLKKNTPVTPIRVLISSIIAAPLVFYVQFNMALNSFVETTYLTTIYHWIFLISSVAFIYSLFIQRGIHLTQIFVHFKTMILFGFLIFVHANFIANGLYPLRDKVVADQMAIAEDISTLSKSVNPIAFVELVMNLDSISVVKTTWNVEETMPVLEQNTKDVFLTNENDFIFSWHHDDGKAERSNPKVKLHYTAREGSVNYSMIITINNETANSLYSQFYQMIYVATIAFILVWTLILSFILNKHLGLKIINNATHKKINKAGH